MADKVKPPRLDGANPAVPPALLDDIRAKRARIEAMTEAEREQLAQELSRRHNTPHVDGPYLLWVLRQQKSRKE